MFEDHDYKKGFVDQSLLDLSIQVASVTTIEPCYNYLISVAYPSGVFCVCRYQKSGTPARSSEPYSRG